MLTPQNWIITYCLFLSNRQLHSRSNDYVRPNSDLDGGLLKTPGDKDRLGWCANQRHEIYNGVTKAKRGN